MFGKKSLLTKIVCDNNREHKSLIVFVQINNRGCVIDMNPRVNDTLNVFYGNQACPETFENIRKYIEFQLSEKTDINFNFVEPTIIYQKKKETEEDKNKLSIKNLQKKKK